MNTYIRCTIALCCILCIQYSLFSDCRLPLDSPFLPAAIAGSVSVSGDLPAVTDGSHQQRLTPRQRSHNIKALPAIIDGSHWQRLTFKQRAHNRQSHDNRYLQQLTSSQRSHDTTTLQAVIDGCDCQQLTSRRHSRSIGVPERRALRDPQAAPVSPLAC